MRSHFINFSCFSSLLFISSFSVTIAHASPLQQRSAVNVDSSCERRLPIPVSRPTYSEKLNPLISNAWGLANLAAHDTRFYQSTAYSHYFLPTEVEQVEYMLTNISRALDPKIEDQERTEEPANHVPTVRYSCGSDQSQLCHQSTRPPLIVLDELAGQLIFCDRFFIYPRTTVNLFDQRAASWCQEGMTIDDILVAGVWILEVST